MTNFQLQPLLLSHELSIPCSKCRRSTKAGYILILVMEGDEIVGMMADEDLTCCNKPVLCPHLFGDVISADEFLAKCAVEMEGGDIPMLPTKPHLEILLDAIGLTLKDALELAKRTAEIGRCQRN